MLWRPSAPVMWNLPTVREQCVRCKMQHNGPAENLQIVADGTPTQVPTYPGLALDVHIADVMPISNSSRQASTTPRFASALAGAAGSTTASAAEKGPTLQQRHAPVVSDCTDQADKGAPMLCQVSHKWSALPHNHFSSHHCLSDLLGQVQWHDMPYGVLLCGNM